MRKIRLVGRLDIKNLNLIKSINLEGLRIVGDPNVFAKRYYNDGIDELIFMDCVATLYGRNNLFDIIKKATKDIFVPITVGGGVRSLEDAKNILKTDSESSKIKIKKEEPKLENIKSEPKIQSKKEKSNKSIPQRKEKIKVVKKITKSILSKVKSLTSKK